MSDTRIGVEIIPVARTRNVSKRVDAAISQESVKFKCSSRPTRGKRVFDGVAWRDYSFVYSINGIDVWRGEFTRALSLRAGEYIEDLDVVYPGVGKGSIKKRKLKEKRKGSRPKRLREIFVTKTGLVGEVLGTEENSVRREMSGLLVNRFFPVDGCTATTICNRSCSMNKIGRSGESKNSGDGELPNEKNMSEGELICLEMERVVVRKREARLKPYQHNLVSTRSGTPASGSIFFDSVAGITKKIGKMSIFGDSEASDSEEVDSGEMASGDREVDSPSFH
jgi:hypothetical protein